MIHIGVHCAEECFKICALSEHYCIVGKASFSLDQTKDILVWASRLKTSLNQRTKWFFDDFQFAHMNFSERFIYKLGKSNTVYLVSHHKLYDTVHLFASYSLHLFKIAVESDIAFFLAAADKLVGQSSRYCVRTDCRQNNFDF